MKKILILIVIVLSLVQANAQQSGLTLQFIKIDREVNAMGLSTISIQVRNTGDSTEEFGSPALIEFYAKKANGDEWKRFSEVNSYCFSQKKTLRPNEEISILDINLNILQLICNYDKDMGDLVLTTQSIYIKATTHSFTQHTDVFSDSVKIEILPLIQVDKIAFDSIQRMIWPSPERYTGRDILLSEWPDPEACGIILKEFPASTFADLVRISNAMFWLSPLGRRQYTPKLHAQAKQYLSEIRHTEFDYIRYWIKEIEAQLAEKERQGF